MKLGGREVVEPSSRKFVSKNHVQIENGLKYLLDDESCTQCISYKSAFKARISCYLAYLRKRSTPVG